MFPSKIVPIVNKIWHFDEQYSDHRTFILYCFAAQYAVLVFSPFFAREFVV